MKAKFVVTLTVTETICCATCDYRKQRFRTEQRGFKERFLSDDPVLGFSRTKEVLDANYCELLNVDIANVDGEELKDIPCNREQWQGSEEYYETEFRVQFKDRVKESLDSLLTTGEGHEA